jgi:hypothetical protein
MPPPLATMILRSIIVTTNLASGNWSNELFEAGNKRLPAITAASNARCIDNWPQLMFVSNPTARNFRETGTITAWTPLACST